MSESSQPLSAEPPSASGQAAPPWRSVFYLSPLVRITLLSLYIALTIPLPFLARATAAPLPSWGLGLGIGLGGLILHGVLSEQVRLNESGIQVAYPRWVELWGRRGWFLPWDAIQALKPRSTGQGGLVYYLLSQTGEAYLLPMRVAGFGQLVGQIEAKTGIDTRDIRPLSQPWMYLLLLLATLGLLLVDGWAVVTALQLGIVG